MRFHSKFTFWFLLFCIALCCTTGVFADDTKTMIRDAKAALRTVENSTDPQIRDAKLNEARVLIDKIKAAGSNEAELRTLESKYRYLDGGRSTGKTAAPPPTPDTANVKGVLDDWNAIIKLDKDLKDKTNRFFPNAENISYGKEQTDAVLSLVEDVTRNDKPRILSFLNEFSRKYGEPNDEMNKKIIALTPKNPKKGMYDEENQRPSELPSLAYKNLVDRLAWIQENPKKEAALIMKNAVMAAANADFFMDTRRDEQFAAAEAELNRAKRFNPQDSEITQALASVQANRKKSQADIQKALEAARFPANVSGFSGPGSLSDLTAAVKTYYAGAYPKEKLLAVSVSGNWTATRHNILGQPIQWGLPVFCASQQNEEGVCRVFKMTVLTGIGQAIPKAPPFTDHWTGDSYRMKITNLK